MQFLVSRNFISRETINLLPLTKRKLKKEQISKLYTAAMDTFYPIAINRRFDPLPGCEKEKIKETLIESRTFLIELPKDAEKNFDNTKKLIATVSKKCGCRHVAIRRNVSDKSKLSFLNAL